MRLTLFIIAVVLAGLPSAGCVSAGDRVTVFSLSVWNPQELPLRFPTADPPVRIGLVDRDEGVCDARVWWDLRDRLPWTALRRRLSEHLNRPVQIEELKPFQIAAQLESGRLHFALLSDEDYRRIVEDSNCCVPVARARALDRGGLIVASAKSPVLSIGLVKGRRFAFGPRGDPILHCAATAALSAGGVSLDDIKREILPPNVFQHHISSRSVAREVAYGQTDVGVIDRKDFDEYAETGGRRLPLSFSKDQFRVLGETPSVDFGPFVASCSTDPTLVDSVRSWLVRGDSPQVHALASLGLSGFDSASQANAFIPDER